jgi:hypothetical protein
MKSGLSRGDFGAKAILFPFCPNDVFQLLKVLNKKPQR